MSEPTVDYKALLTKAENDRLCVHNNMAAKQQPWGVTCFHCQQAAEKYPKAFLVNCGVKPGRTNDLSRFIYACAQLDTSLYTLLSARVTLTDYAVDTRYPGVPILKNTLQRKLCKSQTTFAMQFAIDCLPTLT